MRSLLPLLLTLCALSTFALETEHAKTEDVPDSATERSAAVSGIRMSLEELLTELFRLHPCDPNPCANGGTCANTTDGSFTCDCPEPFSGVRCKQVTSHCKPETCGHGNCIFKPSHPFYECECKHPYTPPNCEAGVTCTPNPCQNGGTCVKDNDDTAFECSCPSGFTGTFCEVGPNDCYEDDGESYRGNVGVTVDGDECLNWNSYFILEKLRSPYRFAQFEGLGPHHFCRNPDEDSRPWCFIKNNDELDWKYCNVRPCPTEPIPTGPPTPAPDPTTAFSECGKPRPPVGSRILFGAKSSAGVHPWQVSLQKRPRNSAVPFRHTCGGTLLNSCWVLTAAHCVQDDVEMQVVLGGVNIKKDEAYDQIVPVEKAIAHEHYDKSSFNNDIALLKLTVTDEPFCAKETRFVKAACLPEKLSESRTECMISGWGVTDVRPQGTKHLMEASVFVISREQCSAPQIYGNKILDSMFCAGYIEGGIDSCQGDSGGPLTCEHNGIHYVEGAVSWGQGCGQKDKPGIYTDVSKFVSWITSHMNA